jgi:pentafunctional AROM polypeptide
MSSIPNGRSRIFGIANQRVKECDRIHAVARNLARLGVFCIELDDGLEIVGKDFSTLSQRTV